MVSQIEKQKTNLRSSFETIDFLGLMACIWGSCGHGYPMAASGQNLAFRKCVYEEVGGYTDIMHRVSGDDVLLMQKMRLLGTWLIAFADSDKAHVTHPCSLSWSSLINQRSRWASNAPLMLSVAPFFFVYLTAAYLVNLFLIGLPILYVFGKFELWPIIIMLFAKLLVDWVIFSRITKTIGRCGLKRFWPFWAVLQPLFIVVVGLMGTMGLFRWKHRSQRWGRSVWLLAEYIVITIIRNLQKSNKDRCGSFKIFSKFQSKLTLQIDRITDCHYIVCASGR